MARNTAAGVAGSFLKSAYPDATDEELIKGGQRVFELGRDGGMEKFFNTGDSEADTLALMVDIEEAMFGPGDHSARRAS